MAIPITIPRLGWNMEEGVFVGWLKRDGDAIQAGDSLFSLESEKATEDVECLDSGMLRIGTNAPKPGDSVRVGDVIGYLLQPGETIPSEENVPELRTPALESARAVNMTGALSADATRLTAPAQPSRVNEGDPPISPRARRVAAELGVDWKNLHGSGRTGRIREQDVRAAAEVSIGRLDHADKFIPLSPIRRTIAEKLRHSLNATAPVTLTTTADAQNLVNVRNQLKAGAESETDIPSFTDLFVKLTALALQNHPRLNSRWENDRILE